MTFTEFFTALGQILEETPTLPQVRYDPNCPEAAAPDQLLIGIGRWQDGAVPVEHRGVCLNNKGLGDRFGTTRRYSTVTDLVLAPPEPLRRHWERLTAGCHGPGEILHRFTLVVEDSGPDSCFALLCWLARCSGVDMEELATGNGRRWVQAVRQWEGTGMATDPTTSWAALLSTLGHSHLPVGHGRAWNEALRLTAALLAQGADPDAIPPAWNLSGYVRARAFLDVERQEYLESLGQATCLQLWVPLAGTDGKRRLLVDAYFATETWPSGVRKVFARTDREHTPLGQGFALMGLYRPGARGSGNDMTLSVNPWTGIDLQFLWMELERLETERWQGRRPCDHPRAIASYPPGAGYNQPWWDDGGRYTLLGAPKALADWPDGSRLAWSEVLEAAWRCYSPLSDLRVRNLLGEEGEGPLTECRRESLLAADGAVVKRLLAVHWLPDTARPQSLFQAPTTRRALAALIARDQAPGPLTLNELPAEAELAILPLSGGFAVLHECGVLLFDDWRDEPLPVAALREEVRRCVRWLGTLHKVEHHLAERRQSDPRRDAVRRTWQTLGLLTDLAAQRRRLASARDKNALASPRPDVRRFRTQLCTLWGIEQAAEDLQRRLTQMEDAIRTTSTLRTQGLVQILSVYGLPFAISGTISSQFLSDWLTDPAARLGAYLGLAAALIVTMRLVQHLWLDAATRAAERPADSAQPPQPNTHPDLPHP